MPLLLVVSDPQLRALVRKILVRKGFTLFEAGDATAALAALDALGCAIALVIVDAELPEMAGTDLASQVKQRFPGVPVLLFRSMPLQRNAAPADGFLCKPFGPAELIESVRVLLTGPLQ